MLKSSLGEQEINTPELSNDWLAIEKRLRQRQNRIYAMWFSLSLIVVSSVLWFVLVPAGDSLIANEQGSQTEQAWVSPERENVLGDQTFEQNLDNSSIDLEQPAEPQVINRTVNVGMGHSDIHVGQANEASSEKDASNTWISPIEEVSFSDETLLAQVELDAWPVLELEQSAPGLVTPRPMAIKNPSGYWEVGLAITPSYTDKIMSTNSVLGGLIHRSFREIVNSGEGASLAYNRSLDLAYHWNNGLFVQTGLGLSQRSEQVDYSYTITDFPTVNEVENRIEFYTERQPAFYKEVKHSGSNSYHFVEIPIQLGHRWRLGEHWEWRNQAGLSYMLLVNSLGKKPDYTYLELFNLEEAEYLNRDNYSASLRSGLYYNFKNFVVGAEPIAGMSLNSLNNSSSAIQIQPYFYGFNLTTHYQLK